MPASSASSTPSAGQGALTRSVALFPGARPLVCLCRRSTPNQTGSHARTACPLLAGPLRSTQLLRRGALARGQISNAAQLPNSAPENSSGSVILKLPGASGKGLEIPPSTFANFFVFAYGEPRILRFAANPVDTVYDPRIVPGTPLVANKEMQVYTGFSFLRLPSFADWTQPLTGTSAPAFNAAPNQTVNFNGTLIVTPTGRANPAPAHISPCAAPASAQ